ncbi:MAG TPA: nucleoside-diphosphate sugar epimerase/dehydratase [Gemmatimonadaceae bacterium]|nr:nucleoside-diphosphate sugar epimerase/dehydratase [Gemmatimonadaceae bacterium]
MSRFTERLAGLRNRVFFASDLLLLPLCATVAFAARYEGPLPEDVRGMLWALIGVGVPIKLLLLWRFGLYRRLWRYASVADLEMLIASASACAVVDVALGLAVLPVSGIVPHRLSYAVILLDACLCALAIALPRLTIRVLVRRDRRSRAESFRRTIVVGAGVAGGMIMRELLENAQLGMYPVALLDDDPRKRGQRLHNVPVLGSVSELPRIAGAVAATDVVIAMPSASGRAIREVVRVARTAGLETRTVPGLYEILSGEKRVSALRQIEIQDLLRREPIKTDLAQVASLVRDQVVVVTGAGGSIGSELCRQLARLEPRRIVAVGRGENSIFELLQELGRTFPRLTVDPVIGDVRDHTRMASVMSKYRPFSVFHAAAHKHVPLMEANVAEAVINNVLGTQNVVTLSAEHDVEHFVLISTDKAVRPTSVMGATKRIAEHVVHECAVQRKSGYVSVRFGNVLGSRGSVVPTFMRQIAEGGPVTITHPDMTRYFMTIPEAVQLVLQAAALGDQGEVFVLDMGEPVRVCDLALDLIRLSGLEPGLDIEVHFTGARPGEKLYEELFFKGAQMVPTDHPKILRARDSAISEHGQGEIADLIRAARENRPPTEIRQLIERLVPEYSGNLEAGEFDVADAGERGRYATPAESNGRRSAAIR